MTSEQSGNDLEPNDRLGMTEEQWNWFLSYTRGFGEQNEHGIDLASLRRNLALTPTQRLQRMFRSQIDPDQVKRA